MRRITDPLRLEEIYTGGGIEFNHTIASSTVGNKRLYMSGNIAGFHEGEIIGAHIKFVVSSAKGITETTNINEAVEAYNAVTQ